MIYTSYFSKLRYIDKLIIPISICIYKPKFYNGLEYKIIAPNQSILSEYKNINDVIRYTERYKLEVLSYLNPDKIVDDLYSLTNNSKDIVLVCYEALDKFCHRLLVVNWLYYNRYRVKELI